MRRVLAVGKRIHFNGKVHEVVHVSFCAATIVHRRKEHKTLYDTNPNSATYGEVKREFDATVVETTTIAPTSFVDEAE